jgi:chorismate synthase
VNERGEPVQIAIGGRHDPCIVPRAVPVLEAMVALVLADRLLAQGALART